jgi:hypothetical protein
MTFLEFSRCVATKAEGVILLEGRRSIPPAEALQAQQLARMLARRFPHLRFRSGNADGSDAAFAVGVSEVDPSRLQVVAPYASHRKRFRYPEASYQSPESLGVLQEEAVAYKTVAASPANKRLVELRKGRGPLAAKAAYLIRDTMKVTGHGDFPKPFCGLFYVDLACPMAGGTGHTIRVCEQEGVPCVFQDSWLLWLQDLEAGM